MDEVSRAYETLGLEAPASEAQIKQAYRDLVRVWHPDRFGHDVRLQEAAQEKLKEINGAYEILLASLFDAGTRVGPDTPPAQEPTKAGIKPRVPSWLVPVAVLALCLVIGGGLWAMKLRDHHVTRPVDLPPGRLLASRVITTADDFIVDIFRNGQRVPDSDRKMLSEINGATVEEISLPVHEGDWVVFNVANNRIRWGGAYYFAVAGLEDSGAIAYVSDVQSGNWSCCDTPGDVPRFIAESDYMSSNAVHKVSRPWDQGASLMRRNARGWSGVAIWGTNRVTWIKYRAPRNADMTSIKPAQ